MKSRIFKLAAVSAALVGATVAHAAPPTADLKVTGKLAVPGCTVTTANDGAYDFERISAAMIKPGTTGTPLSPISQPWTITCDALTFMSFSVIDNRAATSAAAGATFFGLGAVNGTGKLGSYTVQLENPTVDGTKSNTYATSGTTFTGATTAYLGTNTKHGWASGNTQLAGKVFSADLKVTPTLAGTTTMNGPVTDTVDLDGSLTLNFAFGL